MTDAQDQQVVETVDKDARTWGMLCHILALTGWFIPFASILAPLIVWLIKKDEMPFVDDQGKESLNFQLTVLLAAIVSLVLAFILIGFFLLVALGIYQIIMVVVASIKANEGVAYRYPYTLRFIK